MQNPVISLVWQFGNLQLLAPIAGMVNDTRSFCQNILTFKPVLLLCTVLTTLAYTTILVKDHVVNPLHMYNFPWSFRLQFGGQCLGGIVFYCLFVQSFRRAVDSYMQQRMLSVWDFST